MGWTLVKKFDIVGIIKPNAALTNDVEDLGKLGKNFTKQDHIVIVGGPGNSLDRIYNYSVEYISLWRGQPIQMWD
jgi:hypothetical protein